MIRYKSITHERSEDAPFMGALISSVMCHLGCKGCFNQHLKELPTKEDMAKDIIATVKANPFNQGIILGGLEWSEQPREMKQLIECALSEKLQVALYTGLDEAHFKEIFPDVYKMPIYIKFGKYDEEKQTKTNIQNGVKLATSNQYFYKGGSND